MNVPGAVTERHEIAYCDRCSKRAPGIFWYDADGRVVDSQGFMRFEDKTVCDDCLNDSGMEMLTPEEQALVPEFQEAVAGLVEGGLVERRPGERGFGGLRLTRAGVAAVVAEAYGGGDRLPLTPQQRNLLGGIVEEDYRAGYYGGAPGHVVSITQGLRKGRWTAAYAALMLTKGEQLSVRYLARTRP